MSVHYEADIQVRPFRWDDLKRLAKLVAAVHGASALGAPTVDGLRRRLAQPGADPEEHLFLAWEGGEAIGYVQVVVEERIARAVMTGGVAPLRRGQGAEALLVASAIAHARDLRLEVLHTEVWADAEASLLTHTRDDFAHVRTHARYLRALPHPTGLAAPAGFRLRMVEPEDVPAVTELQNAAFAGSWGYCPNTPDELWYRIYELHREPDIVLVLERDGPLVAYCWTHEESGGLGTIAMMAVHPGQQSLGLGRAILGAGVDHLLARGGQSIQLTVDAENTAAVRLYESLGFRLAQSMYWYELKLG